MELDQIISISSREGLFKILSKNRFGFIAQSLLNGNKISTKISNQISFLSEIQIIGVSEEKSLDEIFKLIFKFENGLQTKIHYKSSKIDLMNYFSLIYKNYDSERVYPNDVKKIIKWYNILHDKNFFSSLRVENINK